jgi:hypothetical protein
MSPIGQLTAAHLSLTRVIYAGPRNIMMLACVIRRKYRKSLHNFGISLLGTHMDIMKIIKKNLMIFSIVL